ncbi:MAG: hypothetical protein QOG87_2126 [Actinomycetota bacterium]|jgi:hypothetical protein
MTATNRISRDDIESKLRELKGEVDETTEKAKPIGLAAAAVAAVLVVGVVYLLGKRRGTKLSTIVEIRRV